MAAYCNPPPAVRGSRHWTHMSFWFASVKANSCEVTHLAGVSCCCTVLQCREPAGPTANMSRQSNWLFFMDVIREYFTHSMHRVCVCVCARSRVGLQWIMHWKDTHTTVRSSSCSTASPRSSGPSRSGRSGCSVPYTAAEPAEEPAQEPTADTGYTLFTTVCPSGNIYTHLNSVSTSVLLDYPLIISH